MEILIRICGDIMVKSNRVRARFLRRLERNLVDGLKRAGARGRVCREWSRLVLVDAGPESIEILRRTYGVTSFSPVVGKTSANFDEIVETGESLFASKMEGRSFAVRARRSGTHSFTSMDVAKELGARLARAGGKVKLTNPDYEVFVNVNNSGALFYDQVIPGCGGLPAGVGGRALVLLSGGFDSVIAAWRMQKRGIATDYLFCNLAGEAHAKSVMRTARVLWDGYGHGSRPKFYTVDFTDVADAIRTCVKPSHNQVVLKRMFYRIAERVAQDKEIEALVTGECVGQVSSQTLTNLVAIAESIRTPVFRPLIGFDKDEIIKTARNIGTFSVSAGITEYCQLVPDRPVTACSIKSAVYQESYLPEGLIEKTVLTLTEQDISKFDPDGASAVFVESIPKGATLIDCREDGEPDDDPIIGTQHVPLHRVDQFSKDLEKQQTYLLFCGLGYQSAIAAEKMQQRGFEAYSLRGGTIRLKKLLSEN